LGTKLITVGGAIANDVHGKNHHRAGTFGCAVEALELARSDGTRRNCSPEENPELFQATIGGLGLTGLILSARIRLTRIPSAFVEAETVPFRNLEEYLSIARESDSGFEHTSAWSDFLSTGKNFGRGVFFRGNFGEPWVTNRFRVHPPSKTVPVFAPNWLLSRPWMRAFNAAYFLRHGRRSVRWVHYDPFFFPLDGIDRWNRLYGRRGFFQYQFVVPSRSTGAMIRRVEEVLRSTHVRPFLAVLKSFGPKKSPGTLSFPMEGLTVALDFPNLGEPTRQLFDRLDDVVLSEGGHLYPAKDARMSARMFQEGFPAWREFARHVDPKISSDFWRRVTGGVHG
jgi:FAD/FMN-containing dehydrogenase